MSKDFLAMVNFHASFARKTGQPAQALALEIVSDITPAVISRLNASRASQDIALPALGVALAFLSITVAMHLSAEAPVPELIEDLIAAYAAEARDLAALSGQQDTGFAES